MGTKETPQIRELFIDELEHVQGGGPVDDLIRELKSGGNTTMACCEEGSDGCCNDPW